ncbi:MAG: Gfo/Idh/MocA family oxidoreductase [Cyclobacteriaceae bacterium]|jgi:predicted dehydrogenase
MEENQKSRSRRAFISKTSIIAGGVTLSPDIFSAVPLKNPHGNKNDKIRMGFIGLGNRGTQLLHRFMANEDVEITAFCDAYEPYMDRDYSKVDDRWKAIGMIPKMGEKFDGNVKRYSDFRKLLEDKNVDAVCISTPDHWHALQTIAALEAGKDVYVEKPLTINISEGRAMVNAQKKTDRIVAVGLNRRGSSIYQNLSKELQAGKIGKITVASAMRVSNMAPDGIGKLEPADPPPGFDWDMWLGPRAKIPYQYNIAPYKFRWWSNYSSQMGNWGVHYMDVIRWMMGEKAPSAISAVGGKYVLKHDGDIPDTMEVLFEFASGAIVKFSIHEACGGGNIPVGEIELKGTLGNIGINQNRYQVIPSGPGQFQTWKELVDSEDYHIESDKKYGDLNISEDSTANLIRNFLDCVKTREEPWCPLEEGHRSTSFAHLANMSLKLKSRLEWDAEKERVTNLDKANDLMSYEYRDPWKL